MQHCALSKHEDFKLQAQVESTHSGPILSHEDLPNRPIVKTSPTHNLRSSSAIIYPCSVAFLDWFVRGSPKQFKGVAWAICICLARSPRLTSLHINNMLGFITLYFMAASCTLPAGCEGNLVHWEYIMFSSRVWQVRGYRVLIAYK